MKGLFFIISDFLKGKAIYTPLYKLVSISISVLITSKIFERFYFHYQLLDFTEYKLIYRFFVSGNFIVPLLLFLIVHHFFEVAIPGIFIGLASGVVDKYILKIEKFQFKKELYFDFFGEDHPEKIRSMVAGSPFFKYYLAFRKFVISWDRTRVEMYLESKKKSFRDNFKLGFKVLLYIVLCFISVSYFEWILFTVSLTIILSLLLFFLGSYVILEITPSALRKFDKEILSLTRFSLNNH